MTDILRDGPPWFTAAIHEIGMHEIPKGSNDGPAIRRYIALGHCGAPHEPWCAIFANAMLESSGVPGTRSPSSQSFLHHPEFVRLTGPALGAIACFFRGGAHSGKGHVGFYRGELHDHDWILGGNESDMVQIESFPLRAPGWGFEGYLWPKSVALPKIGPVIMPVGSDTHVTNPGKVT